MTTSTRNLVLGLFCTTLLAACASPRLSIEETVFRTKITDTGLKHFEVAMKSARAQPPLTRVNPRDSKQTKKPRQPKNYAKTTKRALMGAAASHIEANQYCTSGYWVIETDTYSARHRLRGECNEAATEQDRQTYPDTITVW